MNKILSFHLLSITLVFQLCVFCSLLSFHFLRLLPQYHPSIYPPFHFLSFPPVSHCSYFPSLFISFYFFSVSLFLSFLSPFHYNSCAFQASFSLNFSSLPFRTPSLYRSPLLLHYFFFLPYFFFLVLHSLAYSLVLRFSSVSACAFHSLALCTLSLLPACVS